MTPVDKAEEPTAETRPPLPPFTLKNVACDIVEGVQLMLYDPFYLRLLGPVLTLMESIAVKVIVARVPYTEIDFKAYMQQVAQIKAGEVDYRYIYGDTGALVYPAGHVQLYYYLVDFLTYHGENILMGQRLFGWLYVMTYACCVLVYASASIPPWAVVMLMGSKRLHSIYVLRMFNDCFTTFFMVLCVLALQQAAQHKRVLSLSTGLTYAATVLFSTAVSVKMNALLYLPGFLILVYLLSDERLVAVLLHVATMAAVQVVIGWRFLQPFTFTPEAQVIRAHYLAGAFDFSRQFLYEWTVNWKFLPERLFLLVRFGLALLCLQVLLLAGFFLGQALTKNTLGKSLCQTLRDALHIATPTLSPSAILNDPAKAPRFVMLVMTLSNVIGVLCARSLHYQFLSWYAWQLPFLLALTGWGLVASTAVWVLHEWCWNVFPATATSSATLLAILVVVVGTVVYKGDAVVGPFTSKAKKTQ